MTTFIYELSDPITKLPRYIGKSDKPKARLRGHIRSVVENPECFDHKSNWIRSLLKMGLKPVLNIIDEVDKKYWIAQYKAWGFDLTNATIGGDGGGIPSPFKGMTFEERFGEKKSKLIKNKLSNAIKNMERDPVMYKKMADTQRKNRENGWVSPLRGTKLTKEHKKKVSEALKGIEVVNKKEVAKVDRRTGEIIETYSSMKQAHLKTGLSRSTIGRSIKTPEKTRGNYIWKLL